MVALAVVAAADHGHQGQEGGGEEDLRHILELGAAGGQAALLSGVVGHHIHQRHLGVAAEAAGAGGESVGDGVEDGQEDAAAAELGEGIHVSQCKIQTGFLQISGPLRGVEIVANRDRLDLKE